MKEEPNSNEVDERVLRTPVSALEAVKQMQLSHSCILLQIDRLTDTCNFVS
jgi:hypothetical protein